MYAYFFFVNFKLSCALIFNVEFVFTEKKLRDAESVKIPEPVDLVVFEEEIQVFERDIEGHQKRIEQINADTHDLKEQFDAAKGAMQEYEEKKKRLTEQIEEVQRAYKQYSEQKTEKEEAVKHYERMLSELCRSKEEEIDSKLADRQKCVAVSLFAVCLAILYQ
jgi:chromosome segregation ATPase